MSSVTVDVVDLYDSDGGISDLVVRSKLQGTVDAGYKIDVKVTDGGVKCHTSISSTTLDKLRTPNSQRLQYDFEKLVYEVFSNDLPERFLGPVQLIGRQVGEDVVKLFIILDIGGGLKDELISFEMEAAADEDESYDLFEWTRILKKDRDSYKQHFKSLDSEQSNIKEDLKKSLKAQEELVEQMQAKQKLHLQVFTRILNDFQSHYNKLLSGEVMDEEDSFNLDHIRNAINEAHEAELAVQPKKRKLVREKKSKTVKSKVANKNKRRLKDDNEVVEDGSEASSTQEPSIPESAPVKAEAMESVHFKFNRQTPRIKDEFSQKAVQDAVDDKEEAETDEDAEADEEDGETEEGGDTEEDTAEEETENEATEEEDADEEEAEDDDEDE